MLCLIIYLFNAVSRKTSHFQSQLPRLQDNWLVRRKQLKLLVHFATLNWLVNVSSVGTSFESIDVVKCRKYLFKMMISTSSSCCNAIWILFPIESHAIHSLQTDTTNSKIFVWSSIVCSSNWIFNWWVVSCPLKLNALNSVLSIDGNILDIIYPWKSTSHQNWIKNSFENVDCCLCAFLAASSSFEFQAYWIVCFPLTCYVEQVSSFMRRTKWKQIFEGKFDEAPVWWMPKTVQKTFDNELSTECVNGCALTIKVHPLQFVFRMREKMKHKHIISSLLLTRQTEWPTSFSLQIWHKFSINISYYCCVHCCFPNTQLTKLTESCSCIHAQRRPFYWFSFHFLFVRFFKLPFYWNVEVISFYFCCWKSAGGRNNSRIHFH